MLVPRRSPAVGLAEGALAGRKPRGSLPPGLRRARRCRPAPAATTPPLGAAALRWVTAGGAALLWPLLRSAAAGGEGRPGPGELPRAGQRSARLLEVGNAGTLGGLFVATVIAAGVTARLTSSSLCLSLTDAMASGDRRQPQAATKPAFGEEEAAELVDKVFGLKAVWVRPLPSYDDQNFHVKVSDGGEAEGAEEYVLKITNSEDSQQPALIEAQTRAMVFLSAHGFPSATPRLTKDGGIMSVQEGGEELQHCTAALALL